MKLPDENHPALKPIFTLCFLTAFLFGFFETKIPGPIAAHAQAVAVQPTIETDPVPSGGDAADDPAIWIHPIDPSLSLIFGTDKRGGGLAVYDLDGNELQFVSSGVEPNNADVRYNFPLAGEKIDIVAFTNDDGNSVGVYKIDPGTRTIQNVAANNGELDPDLNPYGFCLYHSPVTGKYYCFVTTKSGIAKQFELFDDGSGFVDMALVRTIDVGGHSEGCVADDIYAELYIGEEDVGIWKYGAEPGDGSTRTQVGAVDGTRLEDDVEGLTIYYTSNGTGYLIASSQGNDDFACYRRDGDNGYLFNFKIVSGNGIDEVSGTDGIDVINFPLGSGFPFGVFVAQDGTNNGGNQNFKLVPWESIANAVSPALTIDTSWDPRSIGADVPSDPPVINSFTPTSGQVNSTVLITGENFQGTNEVAFNDVAANQFVILSDTQIQATVPAGATSGKIKVTTPAGSAESADVFIVEPTTPPAMPTNLVATSTGASSINLAWNDNASNETGFKIERKEGAGAFAEITTVPADVTSYNDGGLAPETTYTYRIRASNAGGDSEYSNEATATTDETTIDPNTNLAMNKPIKASSAKNSKPETNAVDGDLATYWESLKLNNGAPIEWLRVDLESILPVGRVIIHWKSKKYAEHYKFQVSYDDVNWTTVHSTTSGQRGDEEFEFSRTTTRYIRLYMTRNRKSRYSVFELEVFTGDDPPVAPSSLSATASGSSTSDLSWIDNSSDELGFKIERKEGAGAFSEIAVVAADGTTYSDTGLNASTNYTYRVRAYNGGGHSGYSNEASITTAPPPLPPAAPSSLTATTTGGASIDLSWTDNASNEDGFKIERKEGSAAFAEIVAVGSDISSYSDSGLSPNTTYTYRIKAFNTGGESGYSNEASAATDDVNVSDPTVNLALNKTATASSTDEDNQTAEAIDGNTKTFWKSGKVKGGIPEWFRVDLGATETVGRVIIRWKSKNYAKHYEFQVSQDGLNWTAVYSTASGSKGDEEFEFTQTTGRYVRLYMTQSRKSTYRIEELEVYSGPESTPKLNRAPQSGANAAIPGAYILHQNYPNPFNPSTMIRFSLPEDVYVVIKVINLVGEEVATLVNAHYNAGTHGVMFMPGNLMSGVYIYKMIAGEVIQSQKLLFIK